MTNGPPYLLALAFGLVVSAALYMLFIWPRIEPDEDASDAADEPLAGDPPDPRKG